MEKRLNIAFLWHMHQPLYKDPFTGEYILPWVLLHGTKDYYDMAAILEEFPNVHQTFNIVPSLIEQLNDYASGNAKDRYRALSLKKAQELTSDEKLFILERFFQANWDNMIKPMPRYWELLKKRGYSGRTEDVRDSLRYFTEEDYRDMQTLFNLSWIDPSIREKDKFLSGMVKKGRLYSEEEKNAVLSKQIEIINLILPKYREMKDKGIIELTTSPYYHPILPLLCDSFSAKHALPYITLPKERFQNREDALMEIKMAIELHASTFGEAPKGMWPSEGSVSNEALSLIRKEGLSWIATDEDILANSIGKPVLRDNEGHSIDTHLYRPYSIDSTCGPLNVVFRDKLLSDLIGFEYARWDAEKAAEDFIKRLEKIRSCIDDPAHCLVSVILDGENAWESYKNDGRDFLAALYSRLNESETLKCTTVSEYLRMNIAPQPLTDIYSGSWINHNFKIWIGHPEDNTAWDYIAGARKALTSYQQSTGLAPEKDERVKNAWNELYIAEGSDWFWWYGDEHTTLSDAEFDNLFRAHIKKIYQLIGSEPPQMLDIPIISEVRGYLPAHIPTGFINPVFDGEITNYYEWLGAGRLEHVPISGAMHRIKEARGLIGGISYGFNLDVFFLRFDYLKELAPYKGAWGFTLNFLDASRLKIEVSVTGTDAKSKVLRCPPGESEWVESGGHHAPGGGHHALELLKAADVVEAGIPFSLLGAKGGDELRLVIDIDGGEKGFERWPGRGFLIVTVPTKDFEMLNWMV